MKFSAISLLATTASAFPFLTPRADATCSLVGIKGDVSSTTLLKAFKVIPKEGTPEACRARCYSVEYSSCVSFGIRTSTGGGACHLFDFDIRSNIVAREGTTYTYFPLPVGDGIRGAVPENVAKHYFAETDKTKGSYAACRALCLSSPDGKCKAFGYKDGGNCQLYDTSLIGKVKAKPEWAYIQYNVDCQLPGSSSGGGQGPVAVKKIAE